MGGKVDRNSAGMVLCGVLLGAIVTVVLLILTGLEWGRIVTLINQNPGLATALLSPLATVGTALVGLIGVIYAARQGFKNVVKASEKSAERDRQRRDQERDEERKSLASSLGAELSSLRRQMVSILVTNRQWASGLEEQIKSNPEFGSVAGKEITKTIKAPVYEANISKLGLLGPYLSANVTTLYNILTSEKAPPPHPGHTQKTLAETYRNVADKADAVISAIDIVTRQLARVHQLKPEETIEPLEVPTNVPAG